MLPWLVASESPRRRVVGAWWLLMAGITPFYHPYARLWLPFHAANWIILGGAIVQVYASISGSRAKSNTPPGRWFLAGLGSGRRSDGESGPAFQGDARKPGWSRISYLTAMILLGLGLKIATDTRSSIQPGALGPTDSLRLASSRLASIVPEGISGLRVLVRPSVTFYLAGRIALYPMPGSEALLKPGEPRVWALVDSAILRSEAGSKSEEARVLARLLDRWEIVEEIPSTMGLPTMLDLDPASAQVPNADRSAPLWLLRPRAPRRLP